MAELLKGVENALLVRLTHERVAARVDAIVEQHNDPDGDNPGPDEHEFHCAARGCTGREERGGEGGKGEEKLTSGDVLRRTLAVLDVARDCACKVADANANAARVMSHDVIA
ncbi:hypothetical protein ONZ51_g8073 [Trametes cubensis]|uniref:Uncharacterized protein n=1 Tax=Trametes cubensis TaxID=1111947 RepID=A0AAD7X8W6_9APHY|nr:hypothetical protein ONZ51_g8073 [Trametes cubensis]